MSEFKDFLDQLKVRLTNPLIFSFLISWMVIHWEIILGAFYLSHRDLGTLGFSNFLDFVRSKIDWCSGFWKPLFCALIYTVASPLLRIGVQYFNTRINKWGNARIRKVAKEGFIQYEFYDSLLEEVKGQRSRFEELVKQSNELNHEKEKFQELIHQLQAELKSSSTESTTLRSQIATIYDVSVLRGKWRRTITIDSELLVKDEIQIRDYQIEIKQTDGTYFTNSYIDNFFVDQQGQINFIERSVNSQSNDNNSEHNYISNLRQFGSNKFIGDYNGNKKITFERIPD